MLRKVIG